MRLASVCSRCSIPSLGPTGIRCWREQRRSSVHRRVTERQHYEMQVLSQRSDIQPGVRSHSVREPTTLSGTIRRRRTCGLGSRSHRRLPRVPGATPAIRSALLRAGFLRFAAQATKYRADYPLTFLPSAAHVNYLHSDAETDPKPLLNRYRNPLHYVDSLVGNVLDGIRKQEPAGRLHHRDHRGPRARVQRHPAKTTGGTAAISRAIRPAYPCCSTHRR